MSQAQLFRKLQPYASNDEIQALLSEFIEKKWLSDRRFAEAFVNHYSRKYGSRRLSEELKQRGVDKSLFQEFQPEMDVEICNALSVLKKKFPAPACSPEEKKRQLRFMLYRGFDHEVVKRAWTVWLEHKECQQQEDLS